MYRKLLFRFALPIFVITTSLSACNDNVIYLTRSTSGAGFGAGIPVSSAQGRGGDSTVALPDSFALNMFFATESDAYDTTAIFFDTQEQYTEASDSVGTDSVTFRYYLPYDSDDDDYFLIVLYVAPNQELFYEMTTDSVWKDGLLQDVTYGLSNYDDEEGVFIEEDEEEEIVLILQEMTGKAAAPRAKPFAKTFGNAPMRVKIVPTELENGRRFKMEMKRVIVTK